MSEKANQLANENYWIKRESSKLEEENLTLRSTLADARLILGELTRYIERNTLNFQLEKANYFIGRLQAILEEEATR